jgi:hypothetical protein
LPKICTSINLTSGGKEIKQMILKSALDLSKSINEYRQDMYELA